MPWDAMWNKAGPIPLETEAFQPRGGNVWVLSLSGLGLTDARAKVFSELVLRSWLQVQEGTVVFGSLELFNNPAFGARGLDAILAELRLERVHVQRVKFYRTAVNDVALQVYVEWVQKLALERQPFEVHFSHCDVTEEGIKRLLNVTKTGTARTLWVQLTRNRVNPEFVKGLVTAGKACLARDRMRCGPRHCGCGWSPPPLLHLSGGVLQLAHTGGWGPASGDAGWFA